MTCRAYESSRKCKWTHALLTRLMRYSSSTDTQSSFYQHLVMFADTSLSYHLPTSKSMATCNYEMCHVWNDYQWEHSARFHRTFVVACCTGRIISFVEDEHLCNLTACSLNEDFERPNKHCRARFRSAFQLLVVAQIKYSGPRKVLRKRKGSSVFQNLLLGNIHFE